MIKIEDLKLATNPVIQTLIESIIDEKYSKSLKVHINLHYESIDYLVYSGNAEVYSSSEIDEALEVYNKTSLQM